MCERLIVRKFHEENLLRQFIYFNFLFIAIYLTDTTFVISYILLLHNNIRFITTIIKRRMEKKNMHKKMMRRFVSYVASKNAEINFIVIAIFEYQTKIY